MKTAEYLIKKLKETGIKDFFGVPGDYNFNILYEIENNTIHTYGHLRRLGAIRPAIWVSFNK